MADRYVIFNADDFGASEGINRGIIHCHTQGVLTSTSLMVTGRAAEEAASLSHVHPELSVGLHWDVWGEDERSFDLGDLGAVRDELHRQLDQFSQLMGCPPTHVDSHRHAHRDPRVMPIFAETLEPLGVPIRGDGQVSFVGGFYGQWEFKKTELQYVGVSFLTHLLSEETVDGWTEISCHPGFRSREFSSVYDLEREEEIRTLTDPRVKAAVNDLGIQLRSYRDYARVRGVARSSHRGGCD
jgi:chitin disaccharide deacetylase